MSFYGHPFFIPAQAQRRPSNEQVTLSDLADEERTALAYLRSVQRRREAAEAAAALEARQRAAAAARHQQAVRAAAEQQAALLAAARREKSIREALERERAREQALAVALEQRRREAITEAIAAERARQENAARAYAAAINQQREIAAARQQQLERQQACGQAQCCRAPAQDDDEEIDLAGINQLLGSLFGFNIAQEDLAALRAEQELPEKNPDATTSAPANQVTDKVTGSEDLTALNKLAENVTAAQKLVHEIPDDDTAAVNEFAKDVKKAENIQKGYADARDTAAVNKLAEDVTTVQQIDLKDPDTTAVRQFAADVTKVEQMEKKILDARDTAAVNKLAQDVTTIQTIDLEDKDTAALRQFAADVTKVEKMEKKIVDARDTAAVNELAGDVITAQKLEQGTVGNEDTTALNKFAKDVTKAQNIQKSFADARDTAAVNQFASDVTKVEQAEKEIADSEDTAAVNQFAHDVKKAENIEKCYANTRDTAAVNEFAADVAKTQQLAKELSRESSLNPNAKAFVPHTPEGQLPPELNQLLNQFLGLQVDPAGEGEKAAGAGKVVGDAVVNLNDILKRYGLEFVPDEPQPTEGIEPAQTREPAAEHVPEFVALKELPKSEGAPASAPAAPKPEPEAPIVRAEPHAESPATTTEEPEPEVAERAAPSPPVAADHVPEFIPAAPPAPRRRSSAPFTSTLDHHSNIPPQLRDILENIESAMNALDDEEEPKPEECDDTNCACDAPTKVKCNSGQPCAEPCRKRPAKKVRRAPRPTRKTTADEPVEMTPLRVEAFAELDKIGAELKNLLDNFTFPPQLGFAESTPDGSQPPLLFNRHNTPYHAQAHALLQLILACDAVVSDGDRVIRRRRKELVSRIETALSDLEARRDARWAEVRARRERGESDDEESESSSELTDSEVEGFELL